MSDYQTIYTTSAINTGGRNGVSYLEDGSFEVAVQTPKEMGGKGQGTNPEQLFALGYSACFNSALELVLAQEKITGRSQVKTQVSLTKKGDGPDFRLQVAIEVAIEGQSTIQAQELAEQAHRICPYSRATQGNIQASVTGVRFDQTKHK